MAPLAIVEKLRAMLSIQNPEITRQLPATDGFVTIWFETNKQAAASFALQYLP